MNCQEYWDSLLQNGHEITEAQSGHLAECPSCAARSTAHRALAAGLRSIGEEWRKSEAPVRVEAGLTAAFRMQAGSRKGRSLRPSWWAPVIAWGSAAAAMVALASFVIHGYQPAPSRPTMAAPQHAAQPAIQMAQMWADTDADSDDESAMLGEGFVPLPNAAPIEPDEEWYVIRVKAPRSDIIADGIALSEDQASETLLAEFACGSDGTARAVRLVSDGSTN